MKLSLRCARICVHDEIKKCLTDKPWLFLESSDYSEQVERFFLKKKHVALKVTLYPKTFLDMDPNRKIALEQALHYYYYQWALSITLSLPKKYQKKTYLNKTN